MAENKKGCVPHVFTKTECKGVNRIERLSETVQRMEAELHAVEFILGLHEVGKIKTFIQIKDVLDVTIQTKPFLSVETELKSKREKTSEISHEVFTDCFIRGLHDKALTLSTQLREMSEVLTKI